MLRHSFIGPNYIPPAKVNEKHMNRGLGKLLLAAAEEHSHRCLVAATRVADLFPTHWHEDMQVLGQGRMKSWCLCFLDPVSSTKGAIAKTITEVCKHNEERKPLLEFEDMID